MNKYQFDNPLRKTMATLYSAPQDSKMFGGKYFDVTKAEEFRKSQLSQNRSITMANIITAASARTIAEDVPEFNCYLKRGRIVQRNSVDIRFVIYLPRINVMTYITIKNADKKNIFEITETIKEKYDKIKNRSIESFNNNEFYISKFPWPFRKLLSKIALFITYTCGFEIKKVHLSSETSGALVISNIASIGVDFGYSALLPSAYIPDMVFIGETKEKYVIKNMIPEIKLITTCTIVSDHRIIDAIHLGKLCKGIQKRLNKPELFLNSIE